MNANSMQNAPSTESGPLSIRGPVLFGLMVILVFVGGFGSWSTMASLDSAAIAPGLLVVKTKRKTIQHLEGGILSDIRVAEGDTVEAGDVLLVLDKTKPQANLDVAFEQYASARALQARLVAERDGFAEITYPDDLGHGIADDRLREIKSAQESIFRARKDAMAAQVRILKQQNSQLQAEIGGISRHVASQNEQVSLLRDEEASHKALFEEGLTGKSRMRELQAQIVEIQGLKNKNRAEITRLRRNISESQLRINELKSTQLSEVVRELRDVQVEARGYSEKLLTLTDVSERTEIKAPISGRVMGLQASTIGGVVNPGTPLLDIVPLAEKIIVEARVDPNDIDNVTEGMVAEIQILSFSQRNTLPFYGTLKNISADHFMDERSGQSYYLARVELNDMDSEAHKDIKLTPGMPVQVMIVTGSRSPLDYLIKPLKDSMHRSMRET